MKIYKTLAAFVLSVSLMIGANSCTTYVFKNSKGTPPGQQKKPTHAPPPNPTNPSPKGTPPGQSKGKKSKMPRQH